MTMEKTYLARRIHIKRELIKNLQAEIAQLQAAIKAHETSLVELERELYEKNNSEK